MVEKTSKTFSMHRKICTMILNVFKSHLFVVKVGFLLVWNQKFNKIEKYDHFSNQLIKLIPKMQKHLKKVYFLKKFCQENLFKVTQPLKSFVQKSRLDVDMIVQKYQKYLSIRFRNSFCQFSNFEAQKRTLLAFAGWCHENQLTFMHKTSILNGWLRFNPFHLAFRFYTVKLPKISVV